MPFAVVSLLAIEDLISPIATLLGIIMFYPYLCLNFRTSEPSEPSTGAKNKL